MHVIKYSTSEFLISYNSFLIHVPLISAGHHSDTHKPTKIPIEVEFSVQWVLACPQICLYVRRATWLLKYTKFWRKKEMTVKQFFKVLWIVFLIFILLINWPFLARVQFVQTIFVLELTNYFSVWNLLLTCNVYWSVNKSNKIFFIFWSWS